MEVAPAISPNLPAAQEIQLFELESRNFPDGQGEHEPSGVCQVPSIQSFVQNAPVKAPVVLVECKPEHGMQYDRA
jgi:hypothetical protein